MRFRVVDYENKFNEFCYAVEKEIQSNDPGKKIWIPIQGGFSSSDDAERLINEIKIGKRDNVGNYISKTVYETEIEGVE